MKRLVESIEEHATDQPLTLECLHRVESQSAIDIGDQISCVQCDQLALPDGLTAYKKTPVFNQETIPKGFRRAHSTKKGVWALIIVLSGQVRYVVDYLNDKAIDLDSHSNGIIAPQMEHHLEVVGDVELYVEFYTK